jgi:hypothetical protein
LTYKINAISTKILKVFLTEIEKKFTNFYGQEKTDEEIQDGYNREEADSMSSVMQKSY